MKGWGKLVRSMCYKMGPSLEEWQLGTLPLASNIFGQAAITSQKAYCRVLGNFLNLIFYRPSFALNYLGTKWKLPD